MCGSSCNRDPGMTPRRRSVARRERGLFLPLVLLGGLSIVALIALAIDSARIYRASITLQQAVDAAGIAAARSFVFAPGASLSADAERAYRDSVDIIASNLIAAGIPIDTAADMRDRQEGQFIKACLKNNGTCCYTPGETFSCGMNPSDERRYLVISARMRQPTILLQFIPGMARAVELDAQASMENLKMQAVLVLDRSGSMTDSWSGQTKGAFLKTAAKAFVDTLQPFDELAIVSFSATSDSPTADLVDNQPYNTSSNLAVLQASYENDSFNVFPGAGSPALVQIGTGTTVKTQAKAAIDAISFGGNTDIGSGLWRGRSRLASSGPIGTNVLRIVVVVTDGAPNGDTNNYLPLTWWNAGPRPLNCTSALIGSPNDANQTNPRQRLRALDAIIESDLARNEGAVVFSIGVGQEDSNLASPFQNVSDTSALKRFLLRRVANDQAAMTQLTPYPLPPQQGGFTPPDTGYPWDFPCVPTGRTLVSQPAGQYLAANTGQALIDAFLQVAAVRSRIQP